MKFIVFGLLMLLIQLIVEAAPLPAMGSSYLNTPDNSALFSSFGFELKKMNKDWFLVHPTVSSDLVINEQVDLKHSKLKTVRLSLKKIETKLTLDAYVKKSLRDYNQYGFTVLSTQQAMINNSPAIVIDLIQKNNQTQSRQIFLQKPTNADHQIIMASCLDQTVAFAESVKGCNAAINSFYWK